jgi:hypothetical protein
LPPMSLEWALTLIFLAAFIAANIAYEYARNERMPPEIKDEYVSEESKKESSYDYQRTRVIRLAALVAPDKYVRFDESPPGILTIKFRIVSRERPTEVTPHSGEYDPYDFDKLTDSQVKALITKLLRASSATQH